MFSFILLLLIYDANASFFNSKQSNAISMIRSVSKRLTASILSTGLLFNQLIPVNAADDVTWSDRNRLAAEVWRKVDESFYERSFGGHDWFALRQSMVKRNYKSDEEVYKQIQDTLQQMGDKYTRYLPPAQYSVLMNSALGELCGIGAELELTTDSRVKIINLQPDSPAAASGLQVGDIIAVVDGSDTMGLSPEEVAALLRGKKDTKASVQVARGNVFSIVRQPIRIQGVATQVATVGGRRVGVIKVRSFASTTMHDVATALQTVNKDDQVDMLLLDMRNNAGGLLEGAVETANLFLPPGKIVVFSVAKDGQPRALQTLPGVIDGEAAGNSALPDLTTKLYILVNENTASAAEVLSAALKENNRATLIGHRTFGKGLIQTLEPLSQGGVAITTAKYETPLHNNINKIGLPVDKEATTCTSDTLAQDCLAAVL